MKKINSLQILRAFAAILVVQAHTWSAVKGVTERHTFVDRLGFEWMGNFGVDIFFVLSGFIMLMSVKNSPPTIEKGARFFIARVRRIYPMYLACLAAFLVLYLAWIHEMPWHTDVPLILRNALLLPGLSSEPYYHMVISPAWSLVYEMYFYVWFAVCVAVLPRRYLLVGLAIVLSAVYLISNYVIGVGPQLGWANAEYMIGDPLIFDFLGGALLAILLPSKIEIGKSTIARVLTLAACFSLYVWGYYGLGDYPRLVRLGIPAICIVAVATLCKASSGPLSRILVALGDASYSIYLTQAIWLLFSMRLSRIFPDHPLRWYFVCVAAMVALGWVAHRLVERPLASYFSRRRQQPSEPPAIEPTSA